MCDVIDAAENIMATEQSIAVITTKPDRWVRFLAVTVVLNFASSVFFPMVATDVATPMQLLSCVLPAIWGFYTLFAFRTRRERIVGYVSVVAAGLWSLGAASLAWQNGWSWRW
jgi:hypothetical protein